VFTAFYSLILASTYGSGAYSTSTYNGTSGGGSSNALSNTGIAVAVFVTIAAVLLLTAMVVRIIKRPSKSSQSATVDEDPNQ